MTGITAHNDLFARDLVFTSISTAINLGVAGFNVIENCVATNCTDATNGIFTMGNAQSGHRFINCVVSGGTGRPFHSLATSTGISLEGCAVVNSICTAAVPAFDFAQDSIVMRNCLAYNNKGSLTGNFNISQSGFFINCLAVGPPTNGFNFGGSGPLTRAINCASFLSGVSGATDFQTALSTQGCITLTADPFANAAGGDFSLNQVAGGGAACRAAGFPSTLPGLSTNSRLDIGASQHLDGASPTVFMGRH